MIKKVLKYLYLTLGIAYMGMINYISYGVEPYKSSHVLPLKITFSVISLVLLVFCYILLLKPKWIVKKGLKKETVIALYVAILIVPLISMTN